MFFFFLFSVKLGTFRYKSGTYAVDYRVLH